MDEERWRVFCAVEVLTEARARVAEHIASLRHEAPDARASWARAENFHITLKFLGEIGRNRVESLSRAAQRAVAGIPPFDVAIKGAGAFPPHGIPRVLWLGITDASDGLARLQSRLDKECDREGFPPEQRPFHPHLTIARPRVPKGARRLAALHKEMGFEPIGFPVNELRVIRSELGPGGSRYTGISRHQLLRA